MRRVKRRRRALLQHACFLLHVRYCCRTLVQVGTGARLACWPGSCYQHAACYAIIPLNSCRQ
jgi:hypothetical protein